MNAKRLQSIEIYEISYIEEIKENPATFEPFDVHLVKKKKLGSVSYSIFLQSWEWKIFRVDTVVLLFFYESCGVLPESFDSSSSNFMERMEWDVS